MKRYITVTGLCHYYGEHPFALGQKVTLVKEPANPYDREAIRVELPGLGKVGYVANSTHTVAEGCLSAGRLYDKIGDTARAKVKYILDDAVVCKVCKEKKSPSDLCPATPEKEEEMMQQETNAEPESYVRDATPEEEAEMIRNTPFTGLFGDQ